MDVRAFAEGPANEKQKARRWAGLFSEVQWRVRVTQRECGLPGGARAKSCQRPCGRWSGRWRWRWGGSSARILARMGPAGKHRSFPVGRGHVGLQGHLDLEPVAGVVGQPRAI